MALFDFLFGSPEQPPAPDYTGAAEATAAGNLEAARFATEANRFDQFTPYGSQTWTRGESLDEDAYNQALADWTNKSPQPTEDQFRAGGSWQGNSETADGEYFVPGEIDQKAYADAVARWEASRGDKPSEDLFMKPNDDWEMTQSLTPEAQGLLDSDLRMKTGMAETAEKMLPGLQGLYDNQFTIDESGRPAYERPTADMPTYGDKRQQVMDAIMSRTNEDIERQKQAKRSELYARGIPENSPQYMREMDQINRGYNDARSRAEITASQVAGSEYSSALQGRQQDVGERMDRYNTSYQDYRQKIQDALLGRQTPLNEFNAFRTGTQIQQPNFYSPGMQSTTAGPDYTNATMAQGNYDLAGYNADVAGRNAMIGGLFNLGAAGIGA